ncbi:MAG: N-acetyltransferase family protein [Clostridia bacterium]|nr:N-acetyltransferase family protein [Clostridia bacterium]
MGRIRCGEERDIPQLMDIYNEAIIHTTATFDLKPKDLSDRRAWFHSHHGKYLLLVYEEEAQIAGYASLTRYRERPAFDTTVEISVYIHPDFRFRRIGTQLMQSVLTFARQREDIETIVSLITGDNAASIRLHEKLGFSYCGKIKNAGIKFGRRLDLKIFQLTFV